MKDNEANLRGRIRDNIREYMDIRGLSQKELADETGISTSAISAYINGVRSPRPNQLDAIAKALRISVGDLTDHRIDSYGEGSDCDHERYGLSQRAYLLARAFDKSPALIQQMAERILQDYL